MIEKRFIVVAFNYLMAEWIGDHLMIPPRDRFTIASKHEKFREMGKDLVVYVFVPADALVPRLRIIEWEEDRRHMEQRGAEFIDLQERDLLNLGKNKED